MKKTIILSIFSIFCGYAFAQTATIKITNDEKTQRQEVVEVPLADIEKKLGLSKNAAFIIKNALNQEVSYQKTHDSKVLLDVAVRPCGTAVFTVTKGNPREAKVFVTGRMYPERVDDIAWENDRTAYRLYGPALQANKERAFGIDLWVKNTPDLEVEKRYKVELDNHPAIEQLKKEGKTEEAHALEEATTYHYDHGYGLDCYKVGPTLGCGAPGMIIDDKLILPYSYKSYKILDNGPLRFTVELAYCPTDMGKNKGVVEHRILSLDKGTNYNKMTVWYEGLKTGGTIAPGVVVHSEDTESFFLGKDYAVYADPTDNPTAQNFQIYTGLLFPNGVEQTVMRPLTDAPGAAGHLLGIRHINNNEKFTYYFGSAWSKNDVKSLAEWRLRSEETLAAIKNPLMVNVE